MFGFWKFEEKKNRKEKWKGKKIKEIKNKFEVNKLILYVPLNLFHLFSFII